FFELFPLFRCADVVRVEAKLRAPCFGLTATELRCCQKNCGFKKVRYDTFGVISLAIPKIFMGMPVTIEALLRKYFCMEVIRGATCDRCKSQTGKRDSGLFKKQGLSKVSTEVFMKFVYSFVEKKKNGIYTQATFEFFIRVMI
ncbi:hypothetical protein NECAME_07745, partial [Necator americanus]